MTYYQLWIKVQLKWCHKFQLLNNITQTTHTIITSGFLTVQKFC